LLQIAHAINQFTEKQNGTKALLKERSKETLRNLWCKLKGYMIFVKPPPSGLTSCDGNRCRTDSS
ncbi:MAG: hypothetical protein LBP72_09615, partial [Dysgonamonadaceae bacterium]|nr:hypothetical protein [Dysgonamonadaceae bacterium]